MLLCLGPFCPKHWLPCSELVPISTVQHQGLALTMPCLELGDNSLFAWNLPRWIFLFFIGSHCVGQGKLEFVVLYRERGGVVCKPLSSKAWHIVGTLK